MYIQKSSLCIAEIEGKREGQFYFLNNFLRFL